MVEQPSPEPIEIIEIWDQWTKEAEAAALGIVEAGKARRVQIDEAMAELRRILTNT